MDEPDAPPAPEERDSVGQQPIATLENAIQQLEFALKEEGCLTAHDAAQHVGSLELLAPDGIDLRMWLETSIRPQCGQCPLCMHAAGGQVLRLPTGWTPVRVSTNCIAAYKCDSDVRVLAAWRGCIAPTLVLSIPDMWRIGVHMSNIVVSADNDTNSAWRLCMGTSASIWVGYIGDKHHALVTQALLSQSNYYTASSGQSTIIDAYHRKQSIVDIPVCVIAHSILCITKRSMSVALHPRIDGQWADVMAFEALFFVPGYSAEPVEVHLRLPLENGMGLVPGALYNINIVSAWNVNFLVMFSRTNESYEQVSTVCALATIDFESIPADLTQVRVFTFDIVGWEQSIKETVNPDTLQYVDWDISTLTGPTLYFHGLQRDRTSPSRHLHDHKIQFRTPGYRGASLTHVNESCTVVTLPPNYKYMYYDPECMKALRPIHLLPMGAHFGLRMRCCIEDEAVFILI